MTELKPCPFCGRDAELIFDERQDLYEIAVDHIPTCILWEVHRLDSIEKRTLISKWNARQPNVRKQKDLIDG